MSIIKMARYRLRAHSLRLLRKLNTKTLDTCFYLCYNLYTARAGSWDLTLKGAGKE